MKIVRTFFTRLLSTQFSVQGTAQAIAWSLAFLLPAMQVYGQDEKKISYPVDIQIERAASTTPVAKPVEQTPEDAIRSLYEKAAVSEPERKAVAKKQTVEKSKTKTATSAAEKKSTTKIANKTTNKKTVAEKPEKKAAAKKIVEKKLTPSSTIPAGEQPQKPLPSKAPELLSPVSATEATTTFLPVVPDNTNVVHVKNTEVLSAGTAENLASDDEDKLENSLTAENSLTEGTTAEATVIENTAAEGTAPESDDVPVQPASVDPTVGAPEVAPVVTAVKKIPLPTSNVREAYITEFKKYVEERVVPRVPGIAIAIIAEGKVKVLQAYGVKKVGGRDFIDTDTAFRLASCSKTIAGTTAGILVNDGILKWETPVVSVLPNIQFSNPRYGNQLSLRDILSQSTGLPTHSGDNYIEEGLPFDSVVQKLKAVNFVCPPGKCYAYQNVSFSLFDGMVRNKTGKPYEQYVQEKLFNPLGMQTASFGLAGLKAHNNFALPHVATSKGWYTEKITENYYRMHPAAGANASITDMARWVLAQMGNNPSVLSPTVLNSIHDKVTKNTATQSHYGAREGVTDTHYGIGWRVFDYRGDKNFLHHGGYVLGFQSQMVFNTELQIGMVALSNSNKMPTNIIFDFLDAYEDEKRGPRKILPSVAPLVKKRPAQKGR